MQPPPQWFYKEKKPAKMKSQFCEDQFFFFTFIFYPYYIKIYNGHFFLII